MILWEHWVLIYWTAVISYFQAWCTIASIAIQAKAFQLCSKAFIKLEALNVSYLLFNFVYIYFDNFNKWYFLRKKYYNQILIRNKFELVFTIDLKHNTYLKINILLNIHYLLFVSCSMFRIYSSFCFLTAWSFREFSCWSIYQTQT